MNKIKRTAKKYIKTTKRKDLSGAIDYLTSLGYSIVSFNTPDGDEMVKAYGFDWEKDNLKAFTCCEINGINAVFVDGNLHNNDKLYLLLHEIGHILLNHIGDGKIAHRDKRYSDIEAETFVYEVLNYKNNTGKIAGMVISIVLSFVSGCLLSNTTQPAVHTSTVNTTPRIQQTPQPTQHIPVYHTTPAENTEDVVYVTHSGKKYHRKNCRYVKNKTNITALSIEQAQRKHTPCNVCNP